MSTLWNHFVLKEIENVAYEDGITMAEVKLAREQNLIAFAKKQEEYESIFDFAIREWNQNNNAQKRDTRYSSIEQNDSETDFDMYRDPSETKTDLEKATSTCP